MKNVSKHVSVIVGGLLLAGCEGTFSKGSSVSVDPPVVNSEMGQGETGLRPMARPSGLQTTATTDAPKPSQAAHTAEQFDTTTSAQRAEAVEEAAQASGERKLGATIGSLGNPAEPGFWMKTPLVSTPSKGRVEYPATGKSVAVDLIPIEGPKTAGSRVSLAALRLLGAPLTGLPDLIVYAE